MDSSTFVQVFEWATKGGSAGLALGTIYMVSMLIQRYITLWFEARKEDHAIVPNVLKDARQRESDWRKDVVALRQVYERVLEESGSSRAKAELLGEEVEKLRGEVESLQRHVKRCASECPSFPQIHVSP